jgi:glycosyltransferase involved in cell wall biosynthesis
MKIVHTVESYLPSRHGMAEVVRQLSERLVARGHEVTVATSRDKRRQSDEIQGVRVAGFSVSGKQALGIRGEADRYQTFIKTCGADVVVNFAAQQWATDLVLPIIDTLECKKVLVPTGFSALRDKRFKKYFQSLATVMAKYDACVYLSDTYRDAAWARSQGLDNGVLIPNGAAAEEFDQIKQAGWRERHGIRPDDFLIVHIAGYVSPAKGQLDAIRIVGKAQLGNTCLLLVCPEFGKSTAKSLHWRVWAKAVIALVKGRRSEALPARLAIELRKLWGWDQSKSLRCLSLDRLDTVQALLAADLMLFPSHVECSPLVLFEAAASRTPFLATPAGNTEEICEWLGNGMVLPSEPLNDAQQGVRAMIDESAKILKELVDDQRKRHEMAEKGYRQWRQHFTWERITDQYEALYRELRRKTA